ncbi:MAG TPA: cupin domain-containing protein [Balneolales bacterium]|nr:cupin domain-containing protein [Balneolales bacterium]
MDKINLAEAFSRINEFWSPQIAGELNGQQLRLAKLKGEFVWHHHENEDELFLVIRGRLIIHLRDKDVELREGEFFIVPRGVEHQPESPGEAWVVLFEPAETLNTGNLENERTKRNLGHI